MGETGAENRGLAGVFLLASAVVFLVFFVAGSGRASMEDDGFLWYGVVRVLAGETPLADFTSYDPGRYYWCAAWSLVFGSAWVGVVAGVSVFAALGLFFGLLAARRVVKGGWGLVATAVFLAFWMLPQRKGFEPALTMTAVLVLVRLVENPTLRRHFVLGLFVGVAAFFGRNHGVYSGTSAVLVMLLLRWKSPGYALFRGLAAWIPGVLLGYAPMLLSIALSPEFRDGFLEYFERVVKYGSNKEVSYPWAWLMVWDLGTWSGSVGRLALSVVFLLPLVVVPVGLVAALRTRPGGLRDRALLAVAPIVGLVYFHHVTVASNMPHLAQAIHPVFLTVLALGALWGRGVRASSAPLVLVAAALLVHPTLNYHQGLVGWQLFDSPPRNIVRHDKPVSHVSKRPDAELLERIVRREVPDDEELYIGPFYPGLYVVLGRVSPVREIYISRPALGEEDQRRMIDDLSDVPWALVGPKNQFERWLPVLWEFLERRYEPRRVPDLPPGFVLLRRRSR